MEKDREHILGNLVIRWRWGHRSVGHLGTFHIECGESGFPYKKTHSTRLLLMYKMNKILTDQPNTGRKDKR